MEVLPCFSTLKKRAIFMTFFSMDKKNFQNDNFSQVKNLLELTTNGKKDKI